MQSRPKTFSHIGLSVPNLEQAVKFYEADLGWHTNRRDITIGHASMDFHVIPSAVQWIVPTA